MYLTTSETPLFMNLVIKQVILEERSLKEVSGTVMVINHIWWVHLYYNVYSFCAYYASVNQKQQFFIL